MAIKAISSTQQTATWTGAKTATTGTTFTIATSGGNAGAPYFIVVSVSLNSSTITVSQIQDVNSNVYTRIGSLVNGTVTVELWSTTTSAVSPGTITVTLSATGCTAAGTAISFKGVTSFSAGTTTSGSGTSVTTGAVALSQRDNSLLLMGAAAAASTTLTAVNGIVGVKNDTANTTAMLLYNPTPGGGTSTVTASGTLGTSASWAGVYIEMDGTLPGGGISQLQWAYDANGSYNATETTLSVSAGPSDTVPAGSLIVAMWRTDHKGATVAVSDNVNAGNYAQAWIQQESGANPGEIACFYMKNSGAAGAGVLTVTVTTTIAGNIYLGVLVYPGYSNFDGSASFAYNATPTSSPSSGSVTPTVAGDIAIGIVTEPIENRNFVSTESSGFAAELDDHFGLSPGGAGTVGPGQAHCADDFISDLSASTYNPTMSASFAGIMIGVGLFSPTQNPLPFASEEASQVSFPSSDASRIAVG